MLPTPVFSGFPCDSAGKESTCNLGDLGSIPELGISPGEGKRYALQYSGHGVAKSQTPLSKFHFQAQTVYNLPAMPEIWVRSLGQKDPL